MSTPTYDVKFIKALGARIQKIRRKKDITQEKLASAVDMHVVSIALVENGVPVLGVVHVPAQNVTYYAEKDKGSFKIENGVTQQLHIRKLAEDGVLKIVGSRSHQTPELLEYVEQQKAKFANVDFVAAGSSLKFCLLAEGKADVYPRLGPTMEWDTCAGQIVATEAGAEVLRFDNNQPLLYNRENLLNPFFIVKNPEL